MTHEIDDTINHRNVQATWLDAWMKAAQSTTELVWVAMYRQPVQLAHVCAVGALEMQAEFVRKCTALTDGGLFDADRIGELCAEYAQLTDQVCEDQVQACDRFVELAQVVRGVPLKQLREVSFEYLELFEEFPTPTKARRPERVRGPREKNAA